MSETQLFAGIQEILYESKKPITDQVEDNQFIYRQVTKKSAPKDAFNGRVLKIPQKIRNNRSGFGFRSDNDLLPIPGSVTYDELSWDVSYGYHALGISDPAMEHGSGSGAVRNALTAELENLPIGYADRLGEMFYGDGTGLLASVTGHVGAPDNSFEVDTVQNVEIGDLVDIITRATGVVLVTQRRVTDVDPDNLRVTLDGAAFTATAAMGIYTFRNYQLETNGLNNMSSATASLGGIDPTVAGNEWWAGVTVDHLSNPITLEALGDLHDRLGEISWFLTTKYIRRQAAEQMDSNKRFINSEAVNLKGGYKAIDMDGIPLVSDRRCPKENVYAALNSALKIWELTKQGWYGEGADGLKLRADATGRNTWVAYWRHYFTFVPTNRRRIGRLTNVTDQAWTGPYEP